MILITESGVEMTYLPKRRIPLIVPRTVILAEGCFGRIDHKMTVRYDSTTRIIMTMRPDWTFAVGLIVDQGPVEDNHNLVTHVFNMNIKRVRVPKGDIIAWLVEL